MKTTKHNEATLPLDLNVDEWVCTRALDSHWQEYIVINACDSDLAGEQCTIMARDKLSLVDHRKEIGELKADFDIIKIWTSYNTDKNIRKSVFGLDVTWRDGEKFVLSLKILNPKFMGHYKRFDGTKLYAKSPTDLIAHAYEGRLK